MHGQALESVHAAQLEDMQHRLNALEDLQEQQMQSAQTAQATGAPTGSLDDDVPTVQLEAARAEAAALQRLPDQANDRHHDELETLSRRHAETLRALQDEWEETVSAARDEAAALQRRLEAAEAESAAAASSMAAHLADSNETDGAARRAGAAVDLARAEAEREVERAAAAEEVEAMRDEHEATLNGLAALHAAAIADASLAHAADLARAEARHTVPTQTMSPGSLQALRMCCGIDACSSMTQVGIDSSSPDAYTEGTDHHPCRSIHDALHGASQAAFESAVKAHDAECASLAAAHEEAMASAAASHSAEMDALRAAHAAELTRLRSDAAPPEPLQTMSRAAPQPDSQQTAAHMSQVSGLRVPLTCFYRVMTCRPPECPSYEHLGLP